MIVGNPRHRFWHLERSLRCSGQNQLSGGGREWGWRCRRGECFPAPSVSRTEARRPQTYIFWEGVCHPWKPPSWEPPQASSGRGRGLCAWADQQPLPVSSEGFCLAGLSRQCRTARRFCAGHNSTLWGDHPASSWVSQRIKLPLCVPMTSPSARPPSILRLPAKGNQRGSQAVALWEPWGCCAKELSPARTDPVPGVLLPPCGRGLSPGSLWPPQTRLHGNSTYLKLLTDELKQRLQRQKIVQKPEAKEKLKHSVIPGDQQWSPRCGTRTWRIHIPWELTRNAHSQIPTLDLPNQKLWG